MIDQYQQVTKTRHQDKVNIPEVDIIVTTS